MLQQMILISNNFAQLSLLVRGGELSSEKAVFDRQANIVFNFKGENNLRMFLSSLVIKKERW